MLASIQILFCCLLPALFAFAGCYLSVSACFRHPTIRQLASAATILATNMFSVLMLVQSIGQSGMNPVLPIALIFLAFVFAMIQFATALVLGAINCLRKRIS